MPATVTLSVTSGPSAGLELVLGERTTCIVGRASDCQPQIAEQPGPQLVSRHHCLFDVNPPDVRVRDFGSLNGTTVNGEEIGRRRPDQTPEEGARNEFRERDLADGDEVHIGDTLLRVAVVADHAPPAPSAVAPARCTHCDREITSELGRRRGELVCATCRRKPRAIVRDLLRRAAGGQRDLAAIEGYEIVRELGRGGQGIVHLARREATGELMALKVLLAEVAVEPHARQGFLREIDCTRALEHPNIVAFRGCGSSGGAFFLASEYCDGGNLGQLMADGGGTLEAGQAVAIVAQILDALTYAHSAEVPAVNLDDGSAATGRGVVHRDIKPSNVLLSGAGPARVAKLGDFGLSKAFDRAGLSGHTRTGAVAGTVQFMARQQIVSYKYAKPEVDVWACAATLYHMLTGALVRDFPAGADPIMVVLQHDPVAIRRRDPSIPPKLAEVIDGALIDNPRIAVHSPLELKLALQAAL